MQAKNFARPAAALAASLVLTLTLVTFQRALATTTVASGSRTTVTIGSGSDSSTINVASSNVPVQIMTAETTVGFRAITIGVIQAATPSFPLIQWNALSAGSDTAIASNFASGSGVTMYSCGWNDATTLVTSGTGSFHIHNSSGTTQTVVVTQIW